MPDVTFSLGGIDFTDLAVPDRLERGGEQQLNVHELPGGVRIIDVMGYRYDPITWEGWFRGETATQQSDALDAMHAAGQEVVLSWYNRSLVVVIRRYKEIFRKFYEVRYSITVEVVSQHDEASSSGTDDINSAINNDLSTANGLAAQIGDVQLSSQMSALSTAVGNVNNFQSASSGTIQSVLQPLSSVNARIGTLLNSASSTSFPAPTAMVGNLVPTNPAALAITQLNGQASSFSTTSLLTQMQGVTGRMGTNLLNVSGAGQQVPAAGGNLMKMANQAYGDFTAWTGIARANNLTDPVLTGIQTLTVPPVPDDAGGILDDDGNS